MPNALCQLGAKLIEFTFVCLGHTLIGKHNCATTSFQLNRFGCNGIAQKLPGYLIKFLWNIFCQTLFAMAHICIYARILYAYRALDVSVGKFLALRSADFCLFGRPQKSDERHTENGVGAKFGICLIGIFGVFEECSPFAQGARGQFRKLTSNKLPLIRSQPHRSRYRYRYRCVDIDIDMWVLLTSC